MATVLYPPYIEGKLPAQYGTQLKIPFQLNRATGIADVQGQQIYLRLKHVSTNVVIDVLPRESQKDSTSITFNDSGIHIATFIVPEDLIGKAIQVGQYYKVQLGFGENIYSSIGIFKYTVKPQVIIEGLSENEIKGSLSTYIGRYSNKIIETENNETKVIEEDSSEKVYEYRFDLYNGDTLIETSGKMLHNSTADTVNESSDSFYFKTNLLDNIYYQVVYTVYTNNGLTISSPAYYIRKMKPYKEIYDFSVVAKNYYDDGYIKVSIQKTKGKEFVAGQFRLCRASSLENYQYWGEIDTFVLDTEISDIPIDVYEDYTVQQGVEYKYAFYQLADELMTTLNESEPVIADFEDAFLYDGERQLKLRFNPKIASFKNTLLEQKMDTIGGRYPFVFRNGNTKYKEFSISAMVSMLMDENSKFIAQEQKTEETRTSTKAGSLIQAIRSTNLVSQNFTKERDFKMEVLEWLTNGKIKLFRSPAEGNYIVRLMNTSLSPNDTLGRMLHTFTSTAYEFDNNDFESLKRNGFLHTIEDKIETMRFIQLDLKDYQEETTYETPGAAIVRVFDATPGSKYTFVFANGFSMEVEIGYTGVYELPIDKNNLVKSVKFDPVHAGKIDLGFIGQDKYPIRDIIQERALSLINISYSERCEQYNNSVSKANLRVWEAEKNSEISLTEEQKQVLRELDIYAAIANKTEKIENNEYSISEFDNIIFLRIEATDLETSGKYCILDLNGSSSVTIDLDGVQIYSGTMGEGKISSSETFSLIELKASTKYPELKPTALKISPGVTVDIYYSTLTYTYEN